MARQPSSGPPPGPPSRWATAGEALAGVELLRLAAATPRLARLPRGDHSPVVLIPGLGATDRSLWPLRQFLRDKHHHARSAGLGRIDTRVDLLAERLLHWTAHLADERGHKVALVGWSLGGVLSREVARRRPDLVERVITFGTPVVAPVAVPITAIWSRRDGVVAPGACIDDMSPDVDNIEVSSSHFGMGIDPDVWAIVALRLTGER